MNKTNTVRLLCAGKIPFDLVEYYVDEEDLFRATDAFVCDITE
jgi:hypothetical protein